MPVVFLRSMPSTNPIHCPFADMKGLFPEAATGVASNWSMARTNIWALEVEPPTYARREPSAAIVRSRPSSLTRRGALLGVAIIVRVTREDVERGACHSPPTTPAAVATATASAARRHGGAAGR